VYAQKQQNEELFGQSAKLEVVDAKVLLSISEHSSKREIQIRLVENQN
jgi:hypothetical protein